MSCERNMDATELLDQRTPGKAEGSNLYGFMQLWKPLSKRWDRMTIDNLTRKYKELVS